MVSVIHNIANNALGTNSYSVEVMFNYSQTSHLVHIQGPSWCCTLTDHPVRYVPLYVVIINEFTAATLRESGKGSVTLLNVGWVSTAKLPGIIRIHYLVLATQQV